MPNITSHTSQLIEPVRIDIGKMLLAHEMIKLFPELGDYEAIKTQVNNRWKFFDDSVAIRDFWNLIDSVMMGYELKDVVRLITSENFNWRLEQNYPIDELRFGWGEKIKDFELNGKTAKEVANYLKTHTDDQEALNRKYVEVSPRVSDPILVEEYASDRSLHVHDGNGRLLRAISTGQESLSANIATQVSAPKSNHWVSTSFLQRLADSSATDTLKRVLRESDNAIFEFEKRVDANTQFKQEILSAI